MKLHPRLGAVTGRSLTAGVAAAATVATMFVGTGAAFADDTDPVDAGIFVQKVDGLPNDFIDGVDVSSILSEEESGVVFHDFAGHVADPFDVLAEAGINYVRVRVWNDPFNAAGAGYGAGNTDAARATEIGVRATGAGMKVLVDFQYSDFWADPGKQKAPKAWAGYSLDQTVTAVHEYTADSLQAMKDAGVDVGMVQVGNETNNGVAGVTGIDDMAEVFAAGSAAVHEVYPGTGTDVPLVALHFTNPEAPDNYLHYATSLQNDGVDYDVFASSYYPYWHGSTTNLTSVLSDIATGFGKKVMVAETAYPNTLADADGTTNSITTGVAGLDYPVSVQGQATSVRDVIAAVNAVSGGAGLGVFYWEPAWIPVPGATLSARQKLWKKYGSGWATVAASEYDSGAPTTKAEGSGWDNQALFSSTGYPLESLRVFQYARTGATTPLAVASVEQPSVTFTQGDAIALPSTVTVTYNDSSTAEAAVTWDDVLGLITSPGTYTVHGVVDGGGATTATVTVKAVNYLVDGDFEQGNFQGWYQNGTQDPWPGTFWVQSSGANAYGDYAVNTYDAAAYTFAFQQWVSGLEPGEYIFTGKAQGADLTVGAYGTTSDGTVTDSVALTGYLKWKSPSITLTVPADGSVEVGVHGTGAAAGWSWLDNFELVKAPTGAADTAELADLVDQANALNRSAFSGDSLAAVDSALEGANIVLAASVPTSAQVSDATALVTAALAALVVVGDEPSPTVADVTATGVAGEELVLPTQATVTFFDGTRELQNVAWDDVLGWIDGPGTYTIHGVTSGGWPATATLTVTENVQNYVVNGSFEDPDTTMWNIEGAGASIGASGDSADGDNSIAYYSGDPFSFVASQVITGVPAGDYVLSATGQGSAIAASDSPTIKVSSNGVDESATLQLDGWQVWKTATTHPITVGDDGTVTVAADYSLTAGAWGTVDNFHLVSVLANADTTALDAAVADAQHIDRSLYEAPGLATLDAALAAADVVVEGDGPSQAAIDAVTALVNDALDGLDLIDVAFASAPNPTITGTARYGSTLAVSVGTWVPTPSAVTYQWLRNGVAVSGATGTKYKPAYADIGAKITVAVTGSKADHITAAKTSAPVTIGKGAFTTQPTPKISGTPTVGHRLTAIHGTWSPSPSAFEYQWYRAGKPIFGATSKTYTARASDLGHTITVKVTALKTGYTSASQKSQAVTIVRPFWSTGIATISGVARSGNTLTAHRGLWLPTPTTFTFQWYRNGAAIPGATQVTYKVKSADKGTKVTVKVTAHRSGYLATSDTSTAKNIAK